MTGKRVGRLSKSAKLKRGHSLRTFDCGRDAITRWLHEWAVHAAGNDTAITYVICRGTKKVVGYYALATGSVDHADAPGALRRNAPNPVPVIILARLGVDEHEKGKGIGRSLLADAMRRAIQAAAIVGARALLVHALDEEAAVFYAKFGFKRFPVRFDEEIVTLYLPMSAVRRSL